MDDVIAIVQEILGLEGRIEVYGLKFRDGVGDPGAVSVGSCETASNDSFKAIIWLLLRPASGALIFRGSGARRLVFTGAGFG